LLEMRLFLCDPHTADKLLVNCTQIVEFGLCGARPAVVYRTYPYLPLPPI
jgi:hypothetical protein